MKKIIGYCFVGLCSVLSLYATTPTFSQLVAATNSVGTDSSSGSSAPSLTDVLAALKTNSTSTASSAPSEAELLQATKKGDASSTSSGPSEADLLKALQSDSSSSSTTTNSAPSEKQVIQAIDDSSKQSDTNSTSAPSMGDVSKAIEKDEKEEAEEKKLQAQQQLFVKNLLLNKDYENALSVISDSNLTQMYDQMMTNILVGHYLQNEEILKGAAVSMNTIVAKYTQVLQDFVATYTQLHVPINLDKSGDVYGIFMKLVHAYAQWYIIYKQNILKAIAVGQNYTKNVQSLLQHYTSYDASMKHVISVLPTLLQEKATKLYHAYLVNNLMQVCVSLIRNYANKGIMDDADISLMQQVYDVMWQVQFEGMQVMGFNSYQSFVETITGEVAGVYQVNAQNCLKKINFAQDMSMNNNLFDSAYAYYQQAAKVFEQGNDKASAAAMQKQAQDIENQKNGIQTALSSYSRAEKMIDTDAQLFALATTDVASDITKLQSVSQNLLAAKKICDDSQKTFNDLGDDVQASLALVKSNQAEADLFIREAQIMWLTYLKNNGTNLQQFFNLQGAWNADDALHALQALQTICVKFPNDISKVSAMIPDLQQALKLYGDQGIHVSNAETSNSDLLALLQDTITFLQNFSLWIDTITLMGSTEMVAHADGLADTVQKAVSQGKLLDQAYTHNSNLGMLVPNFAQSVMPAGMQSFQNVAATYAYIVAKQQADSFIAQAQATTDQIQKIALQASALSYYSATKSVEQFLSHDQQMIINDAVTKLSAAVDVTKQAQDAVKAARACGDWTITSGATTYTSQATVLWQKAINMNYIAVTIAATSEKHAAEIQYLQVVQEYVETYQTHAPFSITAQLDELLLYYRLYIGYVILNNDQQKVILTKITNLLSNSLKTGFFDKLSQLLSTESAEKDQTKAYQESEQIAQMVINFESLVQQENLIQSQMQHLFDSTATLPKLFVKNTASHNSSDLEFVVDGHVQKTVHIPDLVALKVAHAIASGDSNFSKAVAFEKADKFYKAGRYYTFAQNDYKTAVLTSQDATVINQAKQKYFLSVTRGKAALLAGMVVAYGNQAEIKDVIAPEGYVIRQYQVEIPMNFVSPLPTNLAALEGAGFIAPSSSVMQIATDMFYGFVVSQMLSHQHMSFDDCYENYQLTRKPGLSYSVSQQLDEIEVMLDGFQQAVENGMKNGYSIDGENQKTNYKIYVQATGITFSWDYLPIDAVTPLYTTMPYGAEYAIGAYALFKPGTKLLQLGGGGPAYVPGQDQSAATAMQGVLADMYVVEAVFNLQQAQKLEQKLTAALTTDVSLASFALDNYMTEFQEVISLYDTALSLLIAQGQSATSYFNELKDTKSYNAVMSYIATVYDNQASFIQKCLVGDPTTNAYSTVLKNLNMVYLSQGSLPGGDKNEFNEKIAELFKQAGDACMNYAYVDPMTGLHQHHCITAASNYSAAASQYKSLGNADEEQKMNILVNKAYFYACAENMQSYFAVKKNGANYVDSSGVTTHVTWNKLMGDYQSFENQYSLQSTMGIDANEVALYNNVKNLLLDAAIYYQVADNNFGQLASATTETSSQVHTDIVAFLQDKKVVATSATDIDYLTAVVNQQISLLAIPGYQYFENNVAKLAAWAGVLFEAVGYTYIYDFLGGIVGATEQAKAQDAQTKWNSVTQAMQVAGTAIQNPSAAYVG